MRNDTLSIFKKEMDRFLHNKASAAAAIILPGLFIFLLWTIMGNTLRTSANKAESISELTIYAVNPSQNIGQIASSAGMTITEISGLPTKEEMHDKIESGSAQAYIVFPKDFDRQTEVGTGPGGAVPQVEVYYNSSDTKSALAYTTIQTMLEQYETSFDNRFDVNRTGEGYDLMRSQDQTSQFAVAFVPFMLLVLVFSSSMSVAAEAIAGEKERGTIATLLATPINRQDIARGKILACSLIGLAIAASSSIGIFLSLPSLMRGQFDAGSYGPVELCLLGLVVLSVTLLVVTIIVIVSTLATSTKEAQTWLTPIMMAVMGIGIVGIASKGVQTNPLFYALPLYNGVESMIGILSFRIDLASIAVCIASNVAFSLLGLLVLERLFKSERVMFAH